MTERLPSKTPGVFMLLAHPSDDPSVGCPTGRSCRAIDRMNLVQKVSALECCINTAVHGFRFARPSGGGVVQVTYPFVLEQVP